MHAILLKLINFSLKKSITNGKILKKILFVVDLEKRIFLSNFKNRLFWKFTKK